MFDFEFACPRCGSLLQGKNEWIGKPASCNRCHTTFTVTGAASGAGVASDPEGQPPPLPSGSLPGPPPLPPPPSPESSETPRTARRRRSRKLASWAAVAALAIAVPVAGFLIVEPDFLRSLTASPLSGASANAQTESPAVDPDNLERTARWVNGRQEHITALRTMMLQSRDAPTASVNERREIASEFSTSLARAREELAFLVNRKVRWQLAVERTEDCAVWLFENAPLESAAAPSLSELRVLRRTESGLGPVVLVVGKDIAAEVAHRLRQGDRIELLATVGSISWDMPANFTWSDLRGKVLFDLPPLPGPAIELHSVSVAASSRGQPTSLEYIQRGDIAFAQGDFESAEKEFAEASRLDPSDRVKDAIHKSRFFKHMSLGEAAMQEYRPDDEAKLAAAIEAFESAAETACQRGSADNESAARKAAERAKAILAALREITSLRADATRASERHEWTEAVALLTQISESALASREDRDQLEKARYHWHVSEAEKAIAANSLDRAEAELDEAYALRSDAPEVLSLREKVLSLRVDGLMRLGQEAAQAGRFEEAAGHLRQALASAPDNAAVLQLHRDAVRRLVERQLAAARKALVQEDYSGTAEQCRLVLGWDEQNAEARRMLAEAEAKSAAQRVAAHCVQAAAEMETPPRLKARQLLSKAAALLPSHPRVVELQQQLTALDNDPKTTDLTGDWQTQWGVAKLANDGDRVRVEGVFPAAPVRDMAGTWSRKGLELRGDFTLTSLSGSARGRPQLKRVEVEVSARIKNRDTLSVRLKETRLKPDGAGLMGWDYVDWTRIIRPEAAAAPARAFFLNEDFSLVEHGKLPATWTADTLLVENDGQKSYLTNFKSAEVHKAVVDPIAFPQDFRLEWLWETDATAYEVQYRAIVGSVTVMLNTQNGWDPEGTYLSIGETKQRVSRQATIGQIVRIALEKRGPVFTAFLDGAQTVTARYDGFVAPTAMTIEVAVVRGTRRNDQFKLIEVTGERIGN